MSVLWDVMAVVGIVLTTVYTVGIALAVALSLSDRRRKARRRTQQELQVIAWEDLPPEVKYDIAVQLQAAEAEEESRSAEERARRRWEDH